METNFVELKRNVLLGACEIAAQWEVANGTWLIKTAAGTSNSTLKMEVGIIPQSS